jgi:hypothetical protein
MNEEFEAAEMFEDESGRYGRRSRSAPGFRSRARFSPRGRQTAARRPQPVRPFIYSLAQAPKAQPRILDAQRRIAGLLRRPLPLSGIPGPAFRWGLRRVQSVYGLPVTGVLDYPTQQVLEPAPAYSEPEPPPEQAPEPFDDSAPPQGADWLPAEDAPAPEDEYNIVRGCHAVLRKLPAVNAVDVATRMLSRPPLPALLPRGAGLYVIWKNKKVFYVGKAEDGIHNRFLRRLALFREFGIAPSILAGFTIVPYIFQSNAKTLRRNCEIRRGAAGGPFPNAVDSYAAVLAVLEARFIEQLRPSQNVVEEGYSGNEITFQIIGRDDADPRSRG